MEGDTNNNMILDEVTGELIENVAGPKIQVLDETTGTFKFVSVPPDDCEISIVEKPKQRKNTRKRTSNPDTWKRNVRQKSHQAGEEYVNSRGKVVPAKTVKCEKDCLTSCKFHCFNYIDTDLKKEIHTEYYKLNQDQKHHFISQTTERFDKKRCTTGSQRKKFTFMYYFKVKGNVIRVCKTFYLNTLNISQKTVYGVHNRKNNSTGLSSLDRRGKHNNHKKISEIKKDFVRKHIESLPTIDAHYCRKDTKRKYLESTLTESKLYDLYKEKCKEENNMEPVKQSYYLYIFNTEYNLGFHKQKKDRCDRCEDWKIAKKGNILNEELDVKYQKHKEEKDFMRKARNHDRCSGKNVLCFDLQNIVSCPHAEISCFFYFSKLNVYNLTAHFSKDKSVHCAIWNETWAGKAANDIASGLICILNGIFDNYTDLTQLILWSDSCVPQNRNSIISFAIIRFLMERENIEWIEIKYSTPGHSAVQEVDNVHSNIDNAMRTSEFFSPLSFCKLLKRVNDKNPYNIINVTTITDFATCTKALDFAKIPFSQVTALKFTQCYFTIMYKTSHGATNYESVNILKNRPQHSVSRVVQFPRDLPIPQQINIVRKKLPAHKVQCLKKMLKFMPLLDKQYFEALLREVTRE